MWPGPRSREQEPYVNLRCVRTVITRRLMGQAATRTLFFFFFFINTCYWSINEGFLYTNRYIPEPFICRKGFVKCWMFVKRFKVGIVQSCLLDDKLLSKLVHYSDDHCYQKISKFMTIYWACLYLRGGLRILVWMLDGVCQFSWSDCEEIKIYILILGHFDQNWWHRPYNPLLPNFLNVFTAV